MDDTPRTIIDGVNRPPPNPSAFRKMVERSAQGSAVAVLYLGPVIEDTESYRIFTSNSSSKKVKSQIDVVEAFRDLPSSSVLIAEELREDSSTLLAITGGDVIKYAARKTDRREVANTLIDIYLDTAAYLPSFTVDNVIDMWAYRHGLRTCRVEPAAFCGISIGESRLDKSSVLGMLDYNLLSANPGSREDGINQLQFYRAQLNTADEANLLNTYFAACDPDREVRCAAERMQYAPRHGKTSVLVPRRARLPENFLDQFCSIPAGLFLMGSNPESDSYSLPEEQPQHALDLPSFKIARAPVTEGEWTLFKKDTTPKFSEDVGISRRLPKTHVSWYEAIDYCTWLTLLAREQGLLSDMEEVTLPSEAEWEKAARGTDGRIYPWGNDFDASCANYRGHGPARPIEVGLCSSKCASPYGVVDLAGNVWEWTRSLWGRSGASPEYGYPYVAHDGREDLNAPGDVRRVVRGGSWYYFDYCLRCSTRNLMYPYVEHSGGGFRIVIRSVSNR